MDRGNPNFINTNVEISTTQTEAANLLNVSRESVVSAKILDQDSEELISKVDRGEIAVSTAATNKSFTISTKSIYIS